MRENLITGTASRSYRKAETEADLALVLDLFPRLKERFKQGGWSLSGGEQQMLAIGRALMSRPSLLMLDEPSLGLAPIVIEQVFDKILELNKRTGLSVLMVEQNSAMALDISARAFVMETGTITLSGPSSALADDPRIARLILEGKFMATKDSFPLVRLALPTKASRFQSGFTSARAAGISARKSSPARWSKGDVHSKKIRGRGWLCQRAQEASLRT